MCSRVAKILSIILLSSIFSTLPGVQLKAQGAVDPVSRGEDLFLTHCASCHGSEGRGNGPVARHLRQLPADLTRIQEPGRPFPRGTVAEIIDGERTVSAHGSRSMPVWGRIFRGEAGYSQAQVDIHELVKYLETIQVHRNSQE